jgi:hypothetical protein
MPGTTIRIIADSIAIEITGDMPYVGLTYNRLDGWYDLASVDSGFVKRPGAPGAFAPAQTFPDEAAIGIEGDYFGSDRADALLMREAILELYNEGRPVVVEVADDLRTTRREAWVANIDIPWTIHPDFKYSIDLKAEDPRRYADAVTVSTGLASSAGVGLDISPLVLPLDFGATPSNGRVTITNPGNADTVTTFTVTDGDMPDGFVIVNVDTGQRLTYVGPVAAGTTITVDTRIRAAFINIDSPSRYLSAPEWWGVPRRGGVTVQFLARGEVTGTPTLWAATSPAYY